MDKNQLRKKLSFISKTFDHHITYRLSPTKSQASSTESSSSLDQCNLNDELNNNKPLFTSTTDLDALGERIFKDFTSLFEKDGNM